MNTPAHDLALLQAASARGEPFDPLFFWGHRPTKDRSIGKSCLSQWYESAFAVSGVTYPTAEHFMMAGKALAFGDHATWQRIVDAPTAPQAKALGRQVAGYDDAEWERLRFDVVVAANRAKFSQHAALRNFLLATDQKVLVEASPLDAVWGIGLAADDARARCPNEWPGLNLLGFALMVVRDSLRHA